MDYIAMCSHAQLAISVMAVTSEDTSVFGQALAASNQAGAFFSSLRSVDPCKMVQIVQERAISEPHTGKCDAILVTPISNPLLVNERDSDGIGAKAYGLVRHLQPKHQKSHQSSLGLLHPSLAMAPPLLSSPVEALTSNVSKVSVILPDDLLLPCMLVKYKKFSDSETKARNEARTYCVSAVSFLAAIGIKGHPIFCLITSGKIGGVMLAWHSKIKDVCIYFHFLVQSSNLATLCRKSTSWSVTSILLTCPAHSKHSSLQHSWLGFVNMMSASRNYFISKGMSPLRMPKG